jgi:hypothetical protein
MLLEHARSVRQQLLSKDIGHSLSGHAERFSDPLPIGFALNRFSYQSVEQFGNYSFAGLRRSVGRQGCLNRAADGGGTASHLETSTGHSFQAGLARSAAVSVYRPDGSSDDVLRSGSSACAMR